MSRRGSAGYSGDEFLPAERNQHAIEIEEGKAGGVVALSELEDGQVRANQEVAQVPDINPIAEVKSRCADQQVCEWNDASGFSRRGVHLRRDLGHIPGEPFHRDRRKDGIQEAPPVPCLLHGLSAMQAVLQFDHGNGREHDLGFSVPCSSAASKPLTGLAPRSAMIDRPESRTNPMGADLAARGAQQWRIARRRRSRRPAPARSRASPRTP